MGRLSAEHGADLAYGAGIALGFVFLGAIGGLSATGNATPTSDFSGFWEGSRALAAGMDPYDPVTWSTTAAALGGQRPDTLVFGYPPWIAFALVPLGLLPLPFAAAVWIWGTLAAAVIATRALLRVLLPGHALLHGLVGLCLLASQPGYQTLFNHQWTFLLLAATATCALALRAHRDRSAAIVALLWLAKPQLFLFTAIGWGWVHRRFALFASAGASAIVLGSWIVVPQWWPVWSALVAPVRISQPATVPALLADIGGAPGRLIGYALVVIGTVIAARFRSDRDATLAVWSALSIAGAIYAWSYDHLLLLVPLILAAGVLTRTDRVAARRLLLAGLGLLLAASPLLYGLALLRGRETASAVLPVIAFTLIVWRLWPLRSAGRTRVHYPSARNELRMS
jgi:hypothetical protein